MVSYVVQTGDTLSGIASKFNSTTDDIMKTNNLADANAIQVGQTLKIPVNLVTPTATCPPTSTPRTPAAWLHANQHRLRSKEAKGHRRVRFLLDKSKPIMYNTALHNSELLQLDVVTCAI